MKEEFVNKRSWFSSEEILDMISAANLIPGPNSTELALHIGYRRAGYMGLLAAGIGFIAPAFLIVTFIAWFYTRFSHLPKTAGVLEGMKPAVVAVLVLALVSFGKTVLNTCLRGVLALGAFLLSIAQFNEIFILAGCAFGYFICQKSTTHFSTHHTFLSPFITAETGPLKSVSDGILNLSVNAVDSPTLSSIFLSFLKIGSVLFGSGYVLFAFLRAEFVERIKWLTEAQLIDAVAVGQMTPGPVFTAATLAGFLMKGFEGALVASVGIFLPAFLSVALSAPILHRLRSSRNFSIFLDGLNLASLGLMASVSVQFAKASFSGLLTGVFYAISLFLLQNYKVNSVWLILAGGGAGCFLS